MLTNFGVFTQSGELLGVALLKARFSLDTPLQLTDYTTNYEPLTLWGKSLDPHPLAFLLNSSEFRAGGSSIVI
jgi:hypothetical protein